MERNQLKHWEHLSKIPNCPVAECEEKDGYAFRWVHNPLEENDFVPLALTEFPPRVLDENDKQCKYYGLSVFDTLLNAKKVYMDCYNRQTRKKLGEKFRAEKGDFIAHVRLQTSDGVSSSPSTSPNNMGHFTLYLYKNAKPQENIIKIFNIFEMNGNN